MRFDDVLARLRGVRWSAAPAWDPRAAIWLRTYYQRLAPYWPADRARLEPADRVVVEAVLGRRTDADRARIAAGTEALLAAARGRKERIEATTAKLVPLVLAWALAVDAGELEPDQDPGAPLLELYEAGLQLAYTHAGIELHYATGWNIARVPTRVSLA